MIMVKTMRSIFFMILILGLCMSNMAQPVAGEDIQRVIKPSDQSIPESIFRKHFKEYVCRHLRKTESDVVVSRFKVKGNRPVPAGTVNFKIFQKGRTRLQGHVRLIAEVNVSGQLKYEVFLSGYVDVFESVVCTSRNLKRGEVIGKEDVYLTKRNVSLLSPKVLTHMDKAEGLRAKHNIKADTCLKEWMLEKAPVVERGDIITIFAESGDLRVTVPGKVLMKGCPGDLIKVQNLMSKKYIYAKVVNSSTVMVEF
ncbi:MAG: flagella basal body P-ring formation protein FlgA [Desulfobacteraceae bacterium 4572_187]|nr:MAG: flagella basal body P-ring formation protein FlgA [Desulfobacteraceae bacterium 4572_187]